ncbi:MAG: response regulator [Candidatus Omnitrophica bacterium]|nr:response regulator [Candidatus Omnitrophota bacterium]MDD5652951.1 response regulator [Candidatus Omnitrophota bacterium]
MSKSKVLVIDDEKDFVKITKLNLEETGAYEVMGLLSAKELISQVHSFKPDVILLDLLMPVIGGLEACQMLNNDPIGKGIPIIVLSALDKKADKVRAYKEGVVEYLVKPIDKKDLIAKIEKVMQLKK